MKFYFFKTNRTPFTTSAKRKLYLPQVTQLELQILDISEKTIHTYHTQHPKEIHQINIDESISPSFSASRNDIFNKLNTQPFNEKTPNALARH